MPHPVHLEPVRITIIAPVVLGEQQLDPAPAVPGVTAEFLTLAAGTASIESRGDDAFAVPGILDAMPDSTYPSSIRRQRPPACSRPPSRWRCAAVASRTRVAPAPRARGRQHPPVPDPTPHPSPARNTHGNH